MNTNAEHENSIKPGDLAPAAGIVVPQSEVYRYLGYKNAEPDAQVKSEIDECIAEMLAASAPRNVVKRFDITVLEDTIEIDDVTFRSRDLARNLAGCKEAFVFAATIGIGADRLIKKATLEQISKAAYYQAIGAAMIEAYCDMVNDSIEKQAEGDGLWTKPRFSPGYGDFDIKAQRDVSVLMDMPKLAGISLTDSLLMVPTKSVTAIVGLSEERTVRGHKSCENCSARETCAFRK